MTMLDTTIPPPPPGFQIDDDNTPPPPEGFVLEGSTAPAPTMGGLSGPSLTGGKNDQVDPLAFWISAKGPPAAEQEMQAVYDPAANTSRSQPTGKYFKVYSNDPNDVQWKATPTGQAEYLKYVPNQLNREPITKDEYVNLKATRQQFDDEQNAVAWAKMPVDQRIGNTMSTITNSPGFAKLDPASKDRAMLQLLRLHVPEMAKASDQEIRDQVHTDYTRGIVANFAANTYQGAENFKDDLAAVIGGSGPSQQVNNNPGSPVSGTVGRALGGALPIAALSIVAPGTVPGVLGAQGVGGAAAEGKKMGYTSEQTQALMLERGIFNMFIGKLIPGGGAAAGAKSALVESGKTLATLQAMNIGFAGLESKVKETLGVKSDDAWEAMVQAAGSGEGWAQSLIFAGIHGVTHQMANNELAKKNPPPSPGFTSDVLYPYRKPVANAEKGSENVPSAAQLEPRGATAGSTDAEVPAQEPAVSPAQEPAPVTAKVAEPVKAETPAEVIPPPPEGFVLDLDTPTPGASDVAKTHGIVWDGMQERGMGKPPLLAFTDPETKGSFNVKSLDEVPTKLAALRERFKQGAGNAGKVEGTTGVDAVRGGAQGAGGEGTGGGDQGVGGARPAGAGGKDSEATARGSEPQGADKVEPQGGEKLDEGVKRTKRQEQIAMPSIPKDKLPTEKPNQANALHLGAMDANGDLVPVKVWREGNRVNYEGADGKMRGSGPYTDSFKEIPEPQSPAPAVAKAGELPVAGTSGAPKPGEVTKAAPEPQAQVERPKKPLYGWNAPELAKHYTMEELHQLRESLTTDPKNANPAHTPGKEGGSIYLYNKETNRRLDKIAYAVTFKMRETPEAPKPEAPKPDLITTSAAVDIVNKKHGADLGEADRVPVGKQSATPDPRVAAFRKLADGMDAQIEEKKNPAISQQNVTRRRANIADSMYQEGERLAKVQRIMKGMADAIERGDLPESLKGIKTRAQVEELLTNATKFEGAWVNRSNWDDVVKGVKGVAGSRKALDEIGYPRGGDSAAYFDTPEKIEAAETLIGMAQKKGVASAKWAKESLARGKRLVAAGITNTEQFLSAKVALEQYTGKAKVDPQAQAKALERKLIGVDIPGFFPTPKPLIDEMLAKLDIKEGDSVLEPSAGKGDIADAIRAQGVAPDVVEQSHTLREILEAKGHKLVGTDALEQTGKYDKIAMNPPFENGADAEHVRHAYDQLNPGGKLVAIMSEGTFSRMDKKASGFREWLKSVGGESEKNEAGSFQGKEAFRQTGTNTRMVTIEKPAAEETTKAPDAPAAKTHPPRLGPDIVEPGEVLPITKEGEKVPPPTKAGKGFKTEASKRKSATPQQMGAEVMRLEAQSKIPTEWEAKILPAEPLKRGQKPIEGIKKLKEFIRVVPEFEIDPTFTVTGDYRLRFRDGGQYTFIPEAIGIEPDTAWVPEERIRLDLNAISKAGPRDRIIPEITGATINSADRESISRFNNVRQELQPLIDASQARVNAIEARIREWSKDWGETQRAEAQASLETERAELVRLEKVKNRKSAPGLIDNPVHQAWADVAAAGKEAAKELGKTLLGIRDPNTLMSGPPQKLAEAVVNFGVKVVKALAITGQHGFENFVRWVSHNAEPSVRGEILGKARRYYQAIRDHADITSAGLHTGMTPDDQLPPAGLKGFQQVAKIAKLPPEVAAVREATADIIKERAATKNAQADADQANRDATAAQDEPRTIKLSDAIKTGMHIRAQAEKAISKLKGMAALGADVREQIAGYAKELPRDIRPDFLDRIAKARTVSDLKGALDKMDRAIETYNQANAATDLLEAIGGRKSTPAEKKETPILDRINAGIVPEVEPFSEEHINPDRLAPHYQKGLKPLVDNLREKGMIEGVAHLADFLQAETDAGRSNAFGPEDLARLRALEGKQLRGRSPDTFRTPGEAAKLKDYAGPTADDTVLLHRAMQHTQFLNEKWVQDGKNWRNRDLLARQQQIVQNIKDLHEPMPETGAAGSMRRPANAEKSLFRRAIGDAQRSLSTLASTLGGGRESALAKLAYDDLTGTKGKSGESKTLALINEGHDVLEAAEKANGWKPADIIRMSNQTERITVGELPHASTGYVKDNADLARQDIYQGRAYIELTPMERMKFAMQWADPDTRAIMLKDHAPILPDGFRGTARHNIPIDQARAEAILDSMTPQERSYVARLRKFNGERIRKEGNAVRLREVGYEDWDNPDHDHRRRDLSQEPKNIRPDQQGFNRAWLESMGRLKEREGGDKPILIGNAREQFLADLDANARYIGMSEPVRALVETLGEPTVRQTIEGYAGRHWINKVMDIAQEVSGTGAKPDPAFNWMRKLRGNVATGILGFRASSPITHGLGGIIESTEFARSSGVDVARFFKQLANPVNFADTAAVGELQADPYLRARWREEAQELESPTNRSQSDVIAKSALGRGVKKAGDFGTLPLKWSDQRIAVAAYKAWQESYRSSHPTAPESEVKAWAIDKTADTIRRTGTVASPLDMAYHQLKMNRQPVLSFMTMFTSKMSKMRNVIDEAMSDTRRAPSQKTYAVLATSLAAVLGTAIAVSSNRALFSYIKGTADEDKRKVAKAGGVEALAELADVATFQGGNVVRGIASLAAHGDMQVLDESAVASQIIKGGEATAKAVGEATNKGTMKKAPGTWAEAIRNAARAAAKFGTLFGVPLDAPEEYIEGILKGLKPKMVHK